MTNSTKMLLQKKIILAGYKPEDVFTKTVIKPKNGKPWGTYQIKYHELVGYSVNVSKAEWEKAEENYINFLDS